MKKKVVAIVPAAGIGKRFGDGTNKTFLKLGGKRLVIRVLEVLESVGGISEIIPVFKKDDIKAGSSLISKSGLSKVKKIASGGRERQDSVFNGLNLIEGKPDIVLIHDGARPLLEKHIVEKMIRQLRGVDGVIAGVPVKDTIKEVEIRSQDKETLVKKTLERETLRAIQTPQVFRYPALMKAYKKAMDDGFYSTDDSAIVEKYGGKIKVIAGSYMNIKITTPEDLDMAGLFFRRMHKEKKK